MTLAWRPLRPPASGDHKCSISLEGDLDNGLLHRVTNLVWTLVHDFGTRTFVLGVE